MSSSATSSSNFQLIFDAAIVDYLEQTKVDLTNYSLAERLQSCQSADDVLDLLQVKAKQFKEYRNGNRKLIDRLTPLVHVLHAFSGILGDAASMVPIQPKRAIFSGIDVLLGAAIAVGASYDALVDMFECVTNFLDRLRIYTEIPSTPIMCNIILKILVEVLSVLALATKQIKQGRFKKVAKKLMGESEIEAVLQRLDRLTHSEARITVAQTLQVVYGLVNNMKVVMNDGEASMNGMRQALVAMQDMTNEINQMKRDQLQRDIRNWLSPPDSSTNHNIAWETHHTGSAAWFTKGSSFREWMSKGSLLWIHGKPGSGKSILCSSIIQEIKEKCDAGLTLMCYHYFDFKDVAKQDIRGLLASLLAQLCAKSDSCNDVLSKLYSRYNAGSQQPDNHALMECLKKMIQLPQQPTIYLIVDALDECPNTSGFPKTAREKVLEFLEDLVELNISNLRICVTSRPEIDIHDVLSPLASHHMSLHDEGGQQKDIVDYVRTIVLTDRKMRRWRAEDKQLVIDILSAKAGGMFRWIVCQLDLLRTCFPPSLRDAVDELPETLDETYERILLEIEEGKREYAHRLFQCLAMSTRPLRVEELAEVLAMRFSPEALPHYDIGWRLEDTREAVLSACSSLVTVVNVEGSPIVQFSHFSVKEYLTSDRLSKAGAELSRYHIVSLPAHTILAQASLGVLLNLGSSVSKQNIGNFPFAMYAAWHWVDHARFEGVSSRIKDGMERLFDAENPSFSTWTWIFDIDYPLKEHMFTSHPTRPEALPLYYATLCGFRDVVEWLLVTRPGEIHARGGYYGTPMHAALAKGDVEIAALLLQGGADINALAREGQSALHIASKSGRRDHIQFLLEHGADVDVKAEDGMTPLRSASWTGELDVARELVRHGAAVDSCDNKGWTPLFTASRYGHSKMVEFLIQSGAAVDSREDQGWTPLFAASRYGHSKIVEFLIQSGAAVDSSSNDGWTPLFAASPYGHLKIVEFLIQSGAAVDSSQHDGWTPLFAASRYGHSKIVEFLIQSGAAVDSSSNDGWTPLFAASRYGHSTIVGFLIQSGAAVDSRDNKGWTPLYAASLYGHSKVVEFLIQSGAAVDSETDGWTPLFAASRCGHSKTVEFLIQGGAAVDSREGQGWTPLYAASRYGHSKIVEFLIQSGASIYSRDNEDMTPFYTASLHGQLDVVRLLIKSSAPVDSSCYDGRTPLMAASNLGHLDVVHELVNRGADVNARARDLRSPLHFASLRAHHRVAALLIERGAEIDERTIDGETPLGEASRNGHLEVVRLLLQHGSNPVTRNNSGWTPLHQAAHNGHLEIMKLLLESGANPSVQNNNNKTPLDVVVANGNREVARIVFECIGDVDSRGDTDAGILDAGSRNSLADAVQPSGSHGEQATTPNFEGTSLCSASREGNADAVRWLLCHGGDVNERNAIHETPLCVASRYGKLDVAKELIKHGAGMNLRDKFGWTPLNFASRIGYPDIVLLLLDHSANVNATNQNGWSSLHLAAGNSHIKIVELLLERGAKAEIRNQDGRTALDEALRIGEQEIAELLSRYDGRGV